MRVLFLNGASSAGKTSLGKVLQDLLSEPHLLLGLDTCFGMVPPRWAGGSNGELRHLGFAYKNLPADDGSPVLAVTYGEVGWRIMTGFHCGIAEIVRAGNSVIIDEMLLDEHVRDDWLEVLAPFQKILIGVQCSLDELTRRERQRTNRPGLARWSADQAHVGMSYDLTVDTTRDDPTTCAHRIVAGLGDG